MDVYKHGALKTMKTIIDVHLKAKNMSPWNNAVFAGGNGSGTLNGNVSICGSMYLLSENLQPTDIALDVSGGAGIYNYYKDINGPLKNRIVPLPTVEYNGEPVETLNAQLYVRRGKVNLGGSSNIGESQVTLNSEKEPLDYVYVADGINGINKVHADTIANSDPDIDFDNGFPEIDADFRADFIGLTNVISEVTHPVVYAALANINPNSNFSFDDGNGNRIFMNGTGELQIAGKIYVDGPVNFNADGAMKIIEYTGKGTIMTAASVGIDDCCLISKGDESFPANVLSIISEDDLDISLSNPSYGIMGTFYAANTLSVSKQTQIVGSIGARNFDFGSNVPKIYSVPSLAANLPDGNIDGESEWHITVGNWQVTNY
jgi:hypothetical protein